MAFETDTAKWSGGGQFPQLLLERLADIPEIAHVRVEDAPATRSEADYQFMSNELYVAFVVQNREERYTRFGVLPASRTIAEKTMTLAGLEVALTGMSDIGAPDYSDDGMLQYLHTE